jgi:hypothetical protein
MPVRVHAQCDRRVAMAELPTHVRDRLASREEQRRERVAHLMGSTATEARRIKEAIERCADVRFVEGGAGDRRKHPLGTGTADLEPGGALPTTPQT